MNPHQIVFAVPGAGKPAAVEKAEANRDRLLAEAADAESRVTDLQAQYDAVRARDAIARAHAHVSAKPAPDSEAEALKPELDAAVRQHEDLARAVDIAAGLLRAAVLEAVREGRWQRTLEERVEAAVAAYEKALMALRSASGKLQEARNMRHLLTVVEADGIMPGMGVSSGVPQATIREGVLEHHYEAAKLLDALAEVVRPKQQATSPANDEALIFTGGNGNG